MNPKSNSDRHTMASVKLGPKGQIVIPKEVREMFSLNPGDSLILLADKKRGIALQTIDKLRPLFMKKLAEALPDEEDYNEEDDEENNIDKEEE